MCRGGGNHQQEGGRDSLPLESLARDWLDQSKATAGRKEIGKDSKIWVTGEEIEKRIVGCYTEPGQLHLLRYSSPRLRCGPRDDRYRCLLQGSFSTIC